MRFLALLQKELRESLPWLLLAGLLLLGIGLLRLGPLNRFGAAGYWQYTNGLTPGETVNVSRLLRPSLLELPALWLAFIAPALGLVLGVRHFWVPLFTRTWSFLLHRSAARSTILWAKLAAAAIGLIVSLGATWTFLHWYACRPDVFPIPESTKVFASGWIYVVLGLVIYLGTALSALSTARWYTTRIFGLAFAALAVFFILMQWKLTWIIALTILAMAILLLQTVAAFEDREF